MSTRRASQLALALTLGASALLAPETARASEDGAMGFPLAFGQILAMVGAASPYLALNDWKNPGYSGLTYELGAGRHLDAFTSFIEMGGQVRRGSPFGFVGRTQLDIAGKDPFRNGYLAMRVDSIGSLELAGDLAGPLSLEALGGLTAWPRLTISDAGTRAFCGVGPLIGLRFRATAARPQIQGEVELAYSALFGAPPTGKLHHLELGPALGYAPWPHADVIPTFELRARFEVGLDRDGIGPSPGVSILGGVRLRFDRPKASKR